jgi:hypothetical protein
MKYKILDAVCTAIILLGAFIVLGSVGCMETDCYTIKEGLIQCAVGAGMVLGGMLAKAAM